MMVEKAITNVSEFCERILLLHDHSTHFRVPEISCLTFFRGQSDCEWKLSPRLYRDGLFGSERALIQELIRVSPSEFDGLDYFDQLVKMQHYGLPTRLLDMTLNPLVALFFACYGSNNQHKDGSVYVFPNLPVSRSFNWSVKLVMTYVFEFGGTSVHFPHLVERISVAGILQPYIDQEQIEDTIVTFLSEIPFIAVLPPLRNQRIASQEGSFLVCGMRSTDLHKDDPKLKNPIGTGSVKFSPISFDTDLDTVWRGSLVLKVSAKHKEKILNELAILGISRARMFPELEYQSAFIAELIKSQQT